MHEINLTAEQIIDRLGGNAKTAELCEVTPGAVSQWVHNGVPKAQLKFLKVVRPDVFQTDVSPRRRASDHKDGKQG